MLLTYCSGGSVVHMQDSCMYAKQLQVSFAEYRLFYRALLQKRNSCMYALRRLSRMYAPLMYVCNMRNC